MSTAVLVEPVDDLDDFLPVFRCISEAFGRQIRDSIWISMNPKWDSFPDQVASAARLLSRWQNTLKSQDATKRKIVGAAIWSQISFVNGHGDLPTNKPGAATLTPLFPTKQHFANQMVRSPLKRRVKVAREKASSDSPALFTLNTCAVNPAFQRRGVAAKLVEWGLEEAQRRGGLECATEASSMGRAAYSKFGFRAEEGAEEDLVYEVDEEFEHRDKPEVLFMRTGAS